jgi:hypothetical protein
MLGRRWILGWSYSREPGKPRIRDCPRRSTDTGMKADLKPLVAAGVKGFKCFLIESGVEVSERSRPVT